MLLTHVIIAVCLLVIILPILFLVSPAGLVGLVTVFVTPVAWERGCLVCLSD